MSNQPQHAKRAHSELAPSKAATWSSCTASLAFMRANPDKCKPDMPTKFALEGTKAHEVADCLMRGQKVPAWATRDMLEHGAGYKRFCERLHGKGIIDKTGVERELPLPYFPEDNGHVDYILVQPDMQRVDVVDYKYGAGVYVAAEQNKQMTVYAMAALEHMKLSWLKDTTPIGLHIYQPRTQQARDNGPVSSWETRYSELALFYERDIAVPAQYILNDKTEHLKFAPSDKACMWCPINGGCPARAQFLLTGELKPVAAGKWLKVMPSIEALSDEQIAAIVGQGTQIVDFIGDVKAYARERALAGKPVAGTKLVTGRGARSWSSPEKVAATLRLFYKLDIATQDYLSPAQVEELVKQSVPKDKQAAALKAIDKLQQRNPGGPVIANADDKRKPYVAVDPALEFSPVVDKPTTLTLFR